MGAYRGDTRVTVTLEHGKAYDFLRELAENDRFRKQMQSSPREALTAYGIDVSDNAMPEVVQLPPKREIERLLNRVERDDPVAATKEVFRQLINWLPPA